MADFNETDLQQAYQMIKPAAVVATKGEHSYNLTPYGWIMPLDYEPVTKVIFSSDPSHQAVANIKRTKEFAVDFDAGTLFQALADDFRLNREVPAQGGVAPADD